METTAVATKYSTDFYCSLQDLEADGFHVYQDSY